MSGLDRLKKTAGLPEKVCIFGAPKTGKTTLVGELARHGFNLIYVDVAAEGSILLKLPEEAQQRITYVPVISTSDTPLAHNTVDKIVRGGHFKICGLHGRVDCFDCKKLKRDALDDWIEIDVPRERTADNSNTILVIDNMSEVSTAIACNIQKGKTLIAPIPDLDKETIQRVTEKESYEDYRIQGGYLNRILSFIQSAKYHCIVTAHEVEAKTETGLERIVPYIGTTNYSANVGRFFGHVLYAQVVNGKHKLLTTTTSSNKVLCGSRLGLNLDKAEDLSIAPIFDGSLIGLGNAQHHIQETKAVLASISIPSTSNTPTKSFSLGVKK